MARKNIKCKNFVLFVFLLQIYILFCYIAYIARRTCKYIFIKIGLKVHLEEGAELADEARLLVHLQCKIVSYSIQRWVIQLIIESFDSRGMIQLSIESFNSSLSHSIIQFIKESLFIEPVN